MRLLIAAFIQKYVIPRRIIVKRSSHEPWIASVDGGPDGSINGSRLVVNDAGFCAGACTTFLDPSSGPGDAELGGACAPDDSTGFSVFVRTFVNSFSSSSSPRSPNTGIVSLGMCTTSTHA